MLSKNRKSAVSASLFNELAKKNVKKSAKDYFIYFFTLMLSVCLFYSFNSVSTQFASLGLEDTLNYLAFSSAVLNAFSVLVCLIMGMLVVYANRFLLRRRKVEMGIYATLGMDRRDLNRLLMKETIRIGFFSLIAGIILGLFAAQILSLLTAKLAGLSAASYHFMVSFKAIVLTVLFFGILFFFTHLFNIRELKKMSLLEMLYSDRKNEPVSEDKKGLTWLLAILSAVLILGGYAVLALTVNGGVFKALAIGGMMLIAGTLFFFMAVLRIAAFAMKKNKRFYFKRLNMYTVSQFSSRIRSEGLSLAMISILLFLSLSLTILGPGIGKNVINGVEYATPYDCTIYYGLSGADTVNDPLEALENGGFHISNFSDAYAAFRVYESPSVTTAFFKESQEQESAPEMEGNTKSSGGLVNIIGIEDYNRLLELQGGQPIVLSGGEYAVTYAFPAMEKTLKAFAQNPGTLKIGDEELSLADQGIRRNAWKNQNALIESGTVVIPQHLAESLKPNTWYVNFNFRKGPEDMNKALYENWYMADNTGFQMWAKQDALLSVTADNLTMTYLGLYLGITFLITAGAVLAIQQLSHSTDHAKRYKLLRKLGASERDIRSSLMKQLRVCFGIPMLAALMNAAAVIISVFRYFEGLDYTDMLPVIGSGILLVLLVYAVYFITTYVGSRRILQIR